MRTNSFQHILPPYDHRPWWRKNLPVFLAGAFFLLWFVWVVVR